MCSILGLVDFEKNCINQKKQIYDLNKVLSHRGPDDEGFFCDENVALAFNRLSIIDLEKGNQPIIFEDVISIFNGEIYNYKEIKEELKNKNYIFKTNSDSEIIPAAFDCWGINFVNKLNGMFAISIYDRKNKKFFLIRDRVGVKPLYYSRFNNKLVFASEIKGIINFPEFKKKINLNAIYSYLAFRYPTNGKNVFFKDINRVDPGCYIEIDISKKKVFEKSYWKIPKINDRPTNFSESYYDERLNELLNLSVERHLISDVPVGVLLSGGLDSSLLSAIAAKKINKVQTFSVSFNEKKYDESKKAKIVSDHIGSKHTNVIISKENFLKNLQDIIEVRDTPVSIPHEYPLFLLNKEIKKTIKVVLSGEGADEFFGGYSRVQKSPFDFSKGLFVQKNFNNSFIKKLLSIDKEFKFTDTKFLDFFFHRYNWFKFNEIDELLNEDIKKQVNKDLVLEPWNKVINEFSNNDFYNQTLSLFQNNHLQCLLERLDIHTMAHSVEARVPFLDHNLIEFINKTPFKYKIKWKSKFHKWISIFSNSENFSEKNDINKYLLRKVSSKYLPNKTVKEKKLGFPLPMNDWMRDEKIKEILLDKKTIDRKIFNRKQIENLYSEKNFKNDPFDFSGKKIWMILNLELWMRSNFE
tara:strand:- start:75 stop:1988 length:1914 start_codon:yes stop_codon:yes gene_type:complete